MLSALLQRKRTHFVLWRPRNTTPPPRLIIGRFKPGNPPALKDEQSLPLASSLLSADLWEIPASACNLASGQTYHYWFEVPDSNVYHDPAKRKSIRCTDPAALCVDWRLRAPAPSDYGEDSRDPASVILFEQGELKAADPDGIAVLLANDAPMRTLPPNNALVIYELPTAWAKPGQAVDAAHTPVGTFRDVLSLIHLPAGPSYFDKLGINCLELLPPADTFLDRASWGYATSNYFAPDYDLGQSDPTDTAAPTALADMTALVRACHAHGIRFFLDCVMAFSNNDPYRNLNYLDFHVQWDTNDPEQSGRNGFGGDLWKFAFDTESYDPVDGVTGRFHPARRHLIGHVLHWMDQFHIDGLRLDSVTNVTNYDFLRQFTDTARQVWRDRWISEGNTGGSSAADTRFLVVGESLPVIKSFLDPLDALWNEDFKQIVRSVIVGENWSGDPSFEWSVRKMIDCRLLGFGDGAQAINYLGSHDVEGERAERLFNYLGFRNIGDHEAIARRIKLAFACLLTAVGVPMIFAGDEFADEHDIKIWELSEEQRRGRKQTDPVNYARLNDPWRQNLYNYVSRLVKLRTTSSALGVNDTRFIHTDFNDAKRILVWVRGRDGTDVPVVTIANFSDWGTSNPGDPNSEYFVPNWPATPPGRSWREVTLDRPVAPNKVAREPLFPWEAKVYTLR